MTTTLSLFPRQEARVRPPAFVPGDDGTVILARDARPVARDPKLPETPAVGGQSLDEFLVDAGEGLVAHRTVSCPVCRGQLRPRYGASGGVPAGGRCDRCDSTLS